MSLKIPGRGAEINQQLENAGRVADFLEFAELFCQDARHRKESCGGHFRVEYQTDDGEAMRDDENFTNVSVWDWTGDPGNPELIREPLEFEAVELTTRSYK